jgi:hypothetical protein
MDIGITRMESLKTQSLAATSFHDRTHTFLGVLNANGTVTGNHWDPAPYKWLGAREVSLQDSPSAKFSTIAMTADAWFYGVSDGKVLAYEIDTGDPYTFRFKGQVP